MRSVKCFNHSNASSALEYRLIGCLFTVESVSACDSHCISAKSTKLFVFFFNITFDQLRSRKLEVLEPAFLEWVVVQRVVQSTREVHPVQRSIQTAEVLLIFLS